MYEIAWLQFVIKLVHQEMHKLQKLDRCDDSVELLGLFEASARDPATKSLINNISVISWRSVLLVEETGVPRENH
jgi:hypothetical protein